VNQIHSKDLVHGDIKPENILVNSYNWLSLTDISSADKPVFCMDDNLQQYNKYFGFLDNNLRCYLAPERWRSPPDTQNDINKENRKTEVTKPMDIFSLGCVIAEILLNTDAEPLFNLVKLNDLRKDKFDARKAMEDTGQIEP
jgi:phosphoinositide-3-kinase regulatory subunit 4